MRRIALSRSTGLQIPMYELNDDRTFSDSGGNPFHRAGSNVADRKDAGDLRRVGRGQRVTQIVLTGAYEPVGVKRKTIAEPPGIRHRTDNDKDGANFVRLSFAASAVFPTDFV